jgi:hypothetical protein
MYTITGSFKDGVAMPDEPVHGYEGRQVLITFLDDSEAVDDFPTVEEVVERIRSLGPNEDNYIPPVRPLSEVLSNVTEVDPVAGAEWDRQWAIIEAEMKRRDLEDDRAEGRA